MHIGHTELRGQGPLLEEKTKKAEDQLDDLDKLTSRSECELAVNEWSVTLMKRAGRQEAFRRTETAMPWSGFCWCLSAPGSAELL